MRYTRTINVNAPPLPPVSTDWGKGSETGTFANDLWTPGRDADGVVNRVSWDLVPLQRWVKVAGTRMDALEAEIKTAIPGWSDVGTEGWNGVTNDWVGCAIDQVAPRLWLLGGGHSGSSNNGLYYVDGFKMKWAVECLPSDSTKFSQAYINHRNGASFTVCDESAAAYSGQSPPINGPYYDEIFWDTGIKKPTARHSYSAMTYCADRQELVMVCRRLWRYSLTQRAWIYKRIVGDAADWGLDGEDGIALYDESRHEVLTSAAGSSGVYKAIGFRLDTETWTQWASPWNLYSSAADARQGNIFTVVTPPFRGSSYGSYAPHYWQYDITTRQVTVSGEDMKYAAGTSINDFAASDSFFDSACLTHMPEAKKFWLWTLMANGVIQPVWVDATTTPWTIGPKVSFANAVPSPLINLERKAVFMEKLGAVMLIHAADQPLNIYRLF